jgi:hypothetical protein
VGERPLDAEVRSALFDFQQFLSDKLPPLMVADAMAVLLKNPPEIVAREVHAWISAQFQGHGSGIPLSDFLYHSVKKVHALGEFRLLPEMELRNYLERLSELLIELCPEPDRAALRQNIALLNSAQNIHAAPVEIVHRQAGSEHKLAGTASDGGGVMMSDAAAAGLRHFTRMLEQWSMHSGTVSEAPVQAVQSQLLSTAAVSSSSEAELDQYLERMRMSGLDTQPKKLFRLLGDALPPWAVPLSEKDSSTELSGPAEAMRKIVTLAEGPGEAARRFRQMVRGAIEQFNEGSLARSATMFELAERIIAERGVGDAEVASIRGTEHEALDSEKLRQHMESKDSHFVLRKVLSFFTLYRIEALLDQLKNEPARDKRRAILAMIEVYGQDARNEATRQLDEILSTKPDSETHFVARNLLYLLSRIPRAADAVLEKELDILAGFSSASYRSIVVREAINVLSQTKHERSEKILITRLHELEQMLATVGSARYTAQEARQLLDRITAALGRIGTPTALSAILEHALRGQEQHGDARGRLSALSGHDLAESPEVLQRIIEAIRNEMPRKLLGLFNQKKSNNLPKMIEALGATTAPEARELLEDIVARYPESDFADTARKVLERLGAAARPAPKPAAAAAPTLAGDLELLGLPNLLQSLSEMRLTGVLSLIDQEDHSISSISLLKGDVARCQRGMLAGKEALFQIFEQSRPASFTFVSRKDEEIKSEGDPQRVSPLVFEAMRRHDELNRARLLVPSSATLSATGAKPVPPPGEKDPSLIRDVWVRAISGQPPSKWEAEISADSYRIWRLLEHWVDSGALQVASGSSVG